MGDEKSRKPERGPDQVISVVGIPSGEAFGTITIWRTYDFSKDWLADALNEAKTGRDHHSRRREIVFAVCFAESYIVEWVRDEVLQRDFGRLSRYFPPGQGRGAIEKWKDVPKSLLADGLIKATPNLNQPYWHEWTSLVDMRNGLIHARASRPESAAQAQSDQAFPSKSDLDTLPPGWPTNVVVTLTEQLHVAVGTPIPNWLVRP